MESRYLDENTLVRLVDELYDEVCIYDNQYRMVYVNRACRRHYGFEPKELIGKRLDVFENDHRWNPSILPYVYRDQKPYAIHQKTQVGADLFTIAVPVFDQEGKLEYVIMSVRDTVNDNLIFAAADTTPTLLPAESAPKILCESEEMKQVMGMVEKAGKTDANCLLMGESGTGKTVLAKYMHYTGPRRDQPFVSVNCASLPRELIESELFGYVKGAFTGAKSNGKQGLFEAANHGTLLLDEISELPVSAQAKLLSAIQEQEILPIGATEPIKIDVKIISATNKDLTKLVESGEFRADLYYRLNVFDIMVPPLRQRKKDIIPLASYFLNQFDERYGKSHTFSQEVIQLFLSYDWKGNIRELRHVMERLTVMVDELIIEPKHLPMNIFSVISPEPGMSHLPSHLDSALETLEKEMLLNAYRRHPTSRGVAKSLGISQTRAVKLIQKYKDYLVN